MLQLEIPACKHKQKQTGKKYPITTQLKLLNVQAIAEGLKLSIQFQMIFSTLIRSFGLSSSTHICRKDIA